MPRITFTPEVDILPLSVEFQDYALLSFWLFFIPKEASEVTLMLLTQIELWGLIQAMIQSWTVPPVWRATHWTPSTLWAIHPPPPLIHIHLIFTNILLSAYFINPSVTMSSFDQISMRFHWPCGGHISCPQGPTLTSPVSSPRAWSLMGVLPQLVSRNGKDNIFHQFSSCSPPVFFLGIFETFHPKWLKFYKDVFVLFF